MGTSSSSKGAGKDAPLVPSWADTDGVGPGPTPPPRRYAGFRRSLRDFARTGDKGSLRRALGHYAATSQGGAKTAARRLSTGTGAGAALLAWAQDVAAGGTGEQWIRLEVASLAGRSVDEVVGTVVDALCPHSGLPDDDAVRASLNAALSSCLEAWEEFDPATMTPEMVNDLLGAFLTEEVFLRIELDSGEALDGDGPGQVIDAENALREFIASVVDARIAAVLTRHGASLDAKAFRGVIDELLLEVFREFETYE